MDFHEFFIQFSFFFVTIFFGEKSLIANEDFEDIIGFPDATKPSKKSASEQYQSNIYSN